LHPFTTTGKFIVSCILIFAFLFSTVGTMICNMIRNFCILNFFLFWIPFYLQAVQIHLANGVKLLEAWRMNY
jgi:hypothetical protein